jgi:predicted DNA-binding WGR domain protein
MEALNLEQLTVLHNVQGNSDKVYIVELVQHSETLPRNGAALSVFSVLVSWGRRTAPRLSTQIRIEREPDWISKEEFAKIVTAKKKAGYTDAGFDWHTGTSRIEIPGYNRVDASQTPGRASTIISTHVQKAISLPTEDSLRRGLH